MPMAERWVGLWLVLRRFFLQDTCKDSREGQVFWVSMDNWNLGLDITVYYSILWNILKPVCDAGAAYEPLLSRNLQHYWPNFEMNYFLFSAGPRTKKTKQRKMRATGQKDQVNSWCQIWAPVGRLARSCFWSRPMLSSTMLRVKVGNRLQQGWGVQVLGQKWDALFPTSELTIFFESFLDKLSWSELNG